MARQRARGTNVVRRKRLAVNLNANLDSLRRQTKLAVPQVAKTNSVANLKALAKSSIVDMALFPSRVLMGAQPRLAGKINAVRRKLPARISHATRVL